ncbi:MAG: magnesium transporter [Rhodobacteraceae bacterium]|nr:magnesium transporter [Paracoccaceae bacterium]
MLPAPKPSPVAASQDVGLRWLDSTAEENRDANAATVRALAELIKQGQRKDVLAALEGWAPSSTLACFGQLPTKRARKLLKWLPDDVSIRVLSEIDPHYSAVLAEDDTRIKFAKVLRKLDRDKAVRLLLSLPDDYAAGLIDGHPEETALRAVLADDDSAEAAMRQGAVVARETDTIGDVVEDIRARSNLIEKIDSLYVVDPGGRLTGFLKLRDLVLNDHGAMVRDVMRASPLAVARDMDQEEVLKLAKKRKESAIAVVDGDGVLLGAIASKELAEIARQEADEDMLLMGGVSPESTRFDTPMQIVLRRLPWLMAGLIGAMIAAMVIGSFEEALTRAAILASFIPVVMATAGNAGMQASTVSIQAISSGAGLDGDFLARLGREVMGACLNGVLLGLGVSAVVLAVSVIYPIDRPLFLGLTVAIALFCVVLLAGTVGTAVPFLLKALKLDPAVATGIFILTANDVFGVLIFFCVAALLYL